MRYLLVLSLLLLPLSAQADRNARMRSNHFDIGLGMNGCVNSGDYECKINEEEIGAGFGLRVGYTYRFLPFLGAGLDFSWGTFSIEQPEATETSKTELSASTLSAIPMLRGFYGYKKVGFNLGLGMGYYQNSGNTTTTSGEQEFSTDTSFSTMTAFKFSLGVAYKISGQMGVGIYYDMIMGGSGEPTVEIDPEPEETMQSSEGEKEADFPGVSQFGLNFYYRL